MRTREQRIWYKVWGRNLKSAWEIWKEVCDLRLVSLEWRRGSKWTPWIWERNEIVNDEAQWNMTKLFTNSCRSLNVAKYFLQTICRKSYSALLLRMIQWKYSVTSRSQDSFKIRLKDDETWWKWVTIANSLLFYRHCYGLSFTLKNPTNIWIIRSWRELMKGRDSGGKTKASL